MKINVTYKINFSLSSKTQKKNIQILFSKKTVCDSKKNVELWGQGRTLLSA